MASHSQFDHTTGRSILHDKSEIVGLDQQRLERRHADTDECLRI